MHISKQLLCDYSVLCLVKVVLEREEKEIKFVLS